MPPQLSLIDARRLTDLLLDLQRRNEAFMLRLLTDAGLDSDSAVYAASIATLPPDVIVLVDEPYLTCYARRCGRRAALAEILNLVDELASEHEDDHEIGDPPSCVHALAPPTIQ